MSDEVIKLVERAHSPLGPSSFSRVETCTASVLTEGRLQRSSIYADEGSVAHALFEQVLESGRETYEWIGTEVELDSYTITVDTEMIEKVDQMVEWVRNAYPDGFQIEKQLEMPGSAMFGYSDVFGVASDALWTVADLKYGSQFVPADAAQLGFYGIMGMAAVGIDLTKIDPDRKVCRTVILQPRLRDPIREHVWTAGELLALRQRLRDVEGKLARGEHHYKAGKHCRWCDRAATCPALRLLVRDAAMAHIAADPLNPPSVADLEEAAALLPAIKNWTKAVQEQITAYLDAGGRMSNARMALGRNNRSWKDDAAAAELMKRHGVDPNQPTVIRSPAMAEKALPKSAKAELMPLITTTRGKPTLALGEDATGEEADMSATALELAAMVPLAVRLTAPKPVDSQ